MPDRTCPNAEKNKERCTCPNTDCSRHGVCCDCVAFHLAKKQLPQCYVKAGITG